MSEEKPRTIADDQRSPASEAADKVGFGPEATNKEDEERAEPEGAAEAADPKTGPDGNPVVPPTPGM